MKMYVLAIAIAAAIATPVAAETQQVPSGDISDKAQMDLPGTKGGATADPTAKPMDSSISTKAQEDQPGIQMGSTAKPTA